jgi:hypothetical protein
MQKIILITAMLLLSVFNKMNAQGVEAIKNSTDWHYRGSKPDSYVMGPDANDANVYQIKSNQSKIYGFGTIMKTVAPSQYAGKTIKMTATVKTENVKSWAGLWMRVDYYNAAVLAFDNMQRRPIRGSKDWANYEVVLFVPEEATAISYGVLLNETGQVWFKNLVITVVDDTTAETGQTKGRNNVSLPFETRAKAISNEIKDITSTEKKALKEAIESIDADLAKGSITKEKANELKMQKATLHANNIESKVAVEQAKLNKLVQDKVDGKVEDAKEYRSGGRTVVLGNNSSSIGSQTEINLTSMKVYNGQEDKEARQSKKTTSQFVFATGVNNVVTDGKVANSDFKYVRSHFYEWGLSYNTRLLQNNNLLHAKYGLSLMYNNLRPTDNRIFVDNGQQTDLVVNPNTHDDSRFRNVNLVIPVHLEFDFTKTSQRDGKTYFKTHDSFRLGLGGYVGTNLKSKQYINYDEAGYKERTVTKGDFNTSNFIYGLSAYVGHKATSLYLKYDLNPLFRNNAVKQNNVSLGLRFDFN